MAASKSERINFCTSALSAFVIAFLSSAPKGLSIIGILANTLAKSK